MGYTSFCKQKHMVRKVVVMTGNQQKPVDAEPVMIPSGCVCKYMYVYVCVYVYINMYNYFSWSTKVIITSMWFCVFLRGGNAAF